MARWRVSGLLFGRWWGALGARVGFGFVVEDGGGDNGEVGEGSGKAEVVDHAGVGVEGVVVGGILYVLRGCCCSMLGIRLTAFRGLTYLMNDWNVACVWGCRSKLCI
jgi:hypothetical protein